MVAYNNLNQIGEENDAALDVRENSRNIHMGGSNADS